MASLSRSTEAMLARIDAALLRIETWCAVAAGGVIVAVVVASFINVAGRALLNVPLNAFVDIMTQSVPLVAFLGIAYCQRHNGHIRMDMLLAKLPPRAFWCTEFAGLLLIFLTVVVLAYGAFLHASRAFVYGDSTEDTAVALWPVKALIVVMFALLALRLVVQMADCLRLVRHPTARPITVFAIESVSQKAKTAQ